MKNVKVILTGLAVLAMCFSCSEEDFLTVDNPNETTTNQFWQNSSHAKSAIMATYSALQSPNMMGELGMSRRTLMADLAYPRGYRRADDLFQLYSWNSNTETVTQMWNELYTGIFRANQVLAYVPDVPMEEEDKNIILGEAHFLRALFYFWLTISYNEGDVPHITEVPTSPDEIYNEITSREVVYDTIYSDLSKARILLPETWDNQNLGRATWGSAAALQGKIHLYEEDWGMAVTYLDSVINSGLYSLIDDPANNFNVVGEHNMESIFEVGFSAAVREGTTPRWYGQFDTPIGSEATARAAQWAAVGFGPSIVQPHGLLGELLRLDTLDPANQINRDRSFSIRYEASIGARIDSLPFFDGYMMDAGWHRNDFGLAWRKYINHNLESEDTENYRSGINERVIRLADVYLMAAEAIVENNGAVTPLALEYLNKIRRRAGVVEKELSDFPTAQSFIDYLIWYERPRELVAEGFGIRWHDLRRRGLIEEALRRIAENEYLNWNNDRRGIKSTNQEWEQRRLDNFTADRRYWPIPSSELTSNPFLNNSNEGNN